MFYRKLTLILFTLFIICLSLWIKADTPFSPGTDNEGGLGYALGVYGSADREMIKKWRAHERLEIEYAMLGVQWDDNREDMVENAKDLAGSVQLDILGAASSVIDSMAKQMSDIADYHTLSVLRVKKRLRLQRKMWL